MFHITLRFLFFSLPIPLFFDLISLNFVLEDTAFSYKVGIPIPVGGGAIAIIFILFFFLSLFNGGSYLKLIDSKSKCIFVLILLFFLICIIIFSNLSIFRTIQLMLPIMLLMFFSIVKSHKVLKGYLISGFLGGTVFFLLHLLSIVFSGDLDYSDVSSFSDQKFPMFWGISIYQSLVSYPAVLGIFFTLSLFVSKYKPKLGFFTAVVTLVLVFLAARRASLFEVLFIFSVLLFFKLVIVGSFRYKELIVIPIFLVFVFYSFVSSPLLSRFLERVSNDTFTGGRSDIYNKALDVLTRDIISFMFGYGGDGSVGFHNFFLDTMFRIGFLGVILYFIVFSYLIYCFYCMVPCISVRKMTFFIIIIFQLIIQMLVNSPLTQVYYLVVLIFSLTFILFYPEKNDYETNTPRYG